MEGEEEREEKKEKKEKGMKARVLSMKPDMMGC